MIHAQVLEDIAQECSDSLFREIVLHSGLSDYQLVQMACVYKFKYEESAFQGRDIGWGVAWQAWVDQGYADQFRQFYRADHNWHHIYDAVRRRQ